MVATRRSQNRSYLFHNSFGCILGNSRCRGRSHLERQLSGKLFVASLVDQDSKCHHGRRHWPSPCSRSVHSHVACSCYHEM